MPRSERRNGANACWRGTHRRLHDQSLERMNQRGWNKWRLVRGTPNACRRGTHHHLQDMIRVRSNGTNRGWKKWRPIRGTLHGNPALKERLGAPSHAIPKDSHMCCASLAHKTFTASSPKLLATA